MNMLEMLHSTYTRTDLSDRLQKKYALFNTKNRGKRRHNGVTAVLTVKLEIYKLSSCKIQNVLRILFRDI